MLETGNMLDIANVTEALDQAVVARLLSDLGPTTTPDQDLGCIDQVTEVSRTMGLKVRGVERRLDNAGIAVAELLISSLRSQRDLKFAASYGQPVVNEFVGALASWNECRAKTIAGHDRLYAIAGILGTREVAAGDIIRPDDDAVMPNRGG